MIDVTREDGIEVLSFSNRVYNCLRRNEINTVGQVLDFPAEEWKNLSNLGAKSVSEVLDVLKELRTGSGRFALGVRPARPPAPELKPEPEPTAAQEDRRAERFSACIKNSENWPTDSGIARVAAKLNQLYVERMGLNVRAVNALKNGEIYTGLQLVQATPQELKNLRSMGAKTIENVLEKRGELLQELEYAFDMEWNAEEEQAAGDAGTSSEGGPLQQWICDLAQFTGVGRGMIWKEADRCRSDHPQADEQELTALLWQREDIRRESCQALLRLVEEHELGVSAPALLSALPPDTPGEVLDGLLWELEEQGRIRIQGDLIQRRLPTAVEYAQNIADERTREILLARLRGETLEEIGQRYGVTRERVRQITKKVLSRRPRLWEDRYLDLFERYEFSWEEFRLAFDEPQETFHYLDMIRSTKGVRKPIRDILADESIPESFRRKSERAIYRQYVTIDGVRVKKQRTELVRYVVQTYCTELTTMEEFLQWYQLLLESIGAADDPSLAVEART